MRRVLLLAALAAALGAPGFSALICNDSNNRIPTYQDSVRCASPRDVLPTPTLIGGAHVVEGDGDWRYEYEHATNDCFDNAALQSTWFDRTPIRYFFQLEVPSGWGTDKDTDRALPLMVVFHGGCDDVDAFVGQMSWSNTGSADPRHDFAVLYVEDPVTTKFDISPSCVPAGNLHHQGYFSHHTSTSFGASVGEIFVDYTDSRYTQTVQWVLDNFAIDSTRMATIGHSKGGSGAMYFAYRHPEWFSAAFMDVPRPHLSTTQAESANPCHVDAVDGVTPSGQQGWSYIYDGSELCESVAGCPDIYKRSWSGRDDNSAEHRHFYGVESGGHDAGTVPPTKTWVEKHEDFTGGFRLDWDESAHDRCRAFWTCHVASMADGVDPVLGGRWMDSGWNPWFVGYLGTTKSYPSFKSFSFNDDYGGKQELIGAGAAITGAVTAPDAGGTTLTDSAATFLSNGLQVGQLVHNTTDQSSGELVSIDSDTQLTHTALTGGTANAWVALDAYSVNRGCSGTDTVKGDSDCKNDATPGDWAGSVNRFLRWDGDTLGDTNHSWSVDLWIADDASSTGISGATCDETAGAWDATYPSCFDDYSNHLCGDVPGGGGCSQNPATQTVSVIPINAQNFAISPSESLEWELKSGTTQVQSGTVTADAQGYATIPAVQVATTVRRLTIRPAALQQAYDEGTEILLLGVPVDDGGLGSPPAAASCADLSSDGDLQALYFMEEASGDRLDQTANANDLAINGSGITQETSGCPEGSACAQSDGTATSLFRTHASLNVDFPTIKDCDDDGCAWGGKWRPDATAGTQWGIFKGNQLVLGIQNCAGTQKWFCRMNDGTNVDVCSDSAASTGAFTFVGCNFDTVANELSIWIDGVKQADTATITDATTSSPSLGIFANQGGTNPFAGDGDEVFFFDRPLTEAEWVCIDSDCLDGNCS